MGDVESLWSLRRLTQTLTNDGNVALAPAVAPQICERLREIWKYGREIDSWTYSMSNTRGVTGGGGIIFVVIPSDRCTYTKEGLGVLGTGRIADVGLLATGQDVPREKGQQCGKRQKDNERLLQWTPLNRDLLPSLSRWGQDRGQRRAASTHICPCACAQNGK